MTRYFTQSWSSALCQEYKKRDEGSLLDQSAGAKYVERGVNRGDQVYYFYIKDGRLFLIGKMKVGQMVFSDLEATTLVRYEVYSGPEHVIAELATPMSFTNEIPPHVAKQTSFCKRESSDTQIC